ncbi:four-jointed box protein 1 [Gastrophryne carolinensis]
MRTTLAFISSVVLLLVAAAFWIRKDHQLVEQPGRPHQRAPRALRIPELPAQSPTVIEGHKTLENCTLEEGVYWPRALDRALPQGFTDEYTQRWQQFARSANVVALERGCGRSTNRLATLSDGSKACVRYGINPEQIQGEVLSYYLSRLLGMPAVPPCILSKVGSPQWSQADLGGTGWALGSLVSITPWMANLTSVLPPLALRAEDGKLRPLQEELHSGQTGMAELAQWGDLIVFDYLTANFDRLVSNLFSLQWDPRVMLRGTNNLHRTPDGTLVWLDNEAGLAHGYRVRQSWDKYNQELLATVCMFRRGVARKLGELHSSRSTAEELHALYLAGEPLAEELGRLTEAEALILQDRVRILSRHIHSCRGPDS